MKITQIFESTKISIPASNKAPRKGVPPEIMKKGGAHKDKKKAAKQGDIKHKNKQLAEGALDELHADLSDKFNEIAPSIKKHKDEQGANRLYAELVAVAKQHGPAGIQALKSMLNSARNSAHMDYDTNPGGFENWFWYLPLGDQMDEGSGIIDAVKGAATKVGDALSTALPKDMRPFDNETAAKNFSTKESLTPLNDVQKLQQDCAELFKYKIGMRPTWDMLQELGMTKDKWEDMEMLQLFMKRLNSWEDNPQVMENAEYDDEAGMADNNLATMQRAVAGIDSLIHEGDNLPEWCQEKIAVAKSMLVAVWDYMASEEQSVAEGQYRRPGSPTAYDRDYQSSVSGMGKHDSLAYQLDGGANDEGWDKEPQQSYQAPQDKPVLQGYYFYNVQPGQEQEAATYGIKQTKSGKWAKAKYSTSGRSFGMQKDMADKAFGPGKWWAPK